MEVLGTTLSLSRFGWIIAAEKDVSETLSWLEVLKKRALFTAAVTLLVVILLAFWFSFRIAKPFRELARVADRIRQGHLEERVAPLPAGEAEAVRDAWLVLSRKSK